MSSTTVIPRPRAGQGRYEEQQLFAAWKDGGDEFARDRLVERFMPLTRKLARRYGHSSEPFEDLQQVAALGLLKALERHEPDRGRPFESFAIPTILGEMRRYFRDCGWAVHVPRGPKERALKVRDAREKLINDDGHAPTATKLGEYLELDVEHVLEALQALQGYETVSLDAPRPGGEEASCYGDWIGGEDERYELVELDATLVSALGLISARDREMLRLRYVEESTQAEIAERIGISQMQVSRLLRRSLEQLRSLTNEASYGRGM
jgi:RNA polymerase sigma-B factor